MPVTELLSNRNGISVHPGHLFLQSSIIRLSKRISFSSLHCFIWCVMFDKITVYRWLKQSVFIYTLLLIVSCRQRPEQIDVSGIPLEIKAGRFEEDLFASKGENNATLKTRYGNFFDLFCYKIIGIGSGDTSLLKDR